MKCARCGFSRGAATECSPGRKPGVNSNPGSQPQRGERFEWIRGILRPYGAGTSTLFHPRACARGYILTPLRGSLLPESQLEWRAAGVKKSQNTTPCGFVIVEKNELGGKRASHGELRKKPSALEA